MNWYPGLTLSAMEKIAITGAMKFYEGRKTEVAAALGISPKTLYNKLDEYANEDVDRERRETEDQRRRDAWIAEQRGHAWTPTPYDKSQVETYEDDAVQPVGLPKRAPAVDSVVNGVNDETPKAAGGRRAR
jgi:hypothetical protein